MLISPAHTHRYRRFADALTGAHARLAEKRGWLILRFSGLSPPILCQLAWRTVPPPRDESGGVYILSRMASPKPEQGSSVTSSRPSRRMSRARS